MTRRSDGRWQGTVTINGVKKYFCGKTQAEVKRKIREYEESVYNPTVYFGDVADEWEENYEKIVSHKTMSQFSPAKKRIMEEFGDRKIDEIEPIDIANFLKRLKADGYSSQYLKAHKAVFSKVFDYEIMSRNSVLKFNPAQSVRLPRMIPKKKHAATPEQEETVRNSLDKPFGLFAYLLLYTGCRSQEALALQWQDVDFHKNTITINKAVTFPHNQAVIKETKSERGNRTIPLLSPLKTALLAHGVERGDVYLFHAENAKKPLSQREYVLRWRQYALAVGFRREYYVDYFGNELTSLSELQKKPHKKVADTTLTPHQLRHSFATMCFEAEIAPEDAQKLLGHADIQTTVNIYTDIRDTKSMAAAQKLDKFVTSKNS